MNYKSYSMCPYLKGDSKGATCASVGMHIKDIEDADIKFCLCRHYESCSIYSDSLYDSLYDWPKVLLQPLNLSGKFI